MIHQIQNVLYSVIIDQQFHQALWDSYWIIPSIYQNRLEHLQQQNVKEWRAFKRESLRDGNYSMWDLLAAKNKDRLDNIDDGLELLFSFLEFSRFGRVLFLLYVKDGFSLEFDIKFVDHNIQNIFDTKKTMVIDWIMNVDCPEICPDFIPDSHVSFIVDLNSPK